MQLYKRGNAWLTAKQLLEYNKENVEAVLSEDKVEDDTLVLKEDNIAEKGSESLTEGVEDVLPTNFMQLKKYAKAKGVDVKKHNTKEKILKELNK